jgi:putative transposase
MEDQNFNSMKKRHRPDEIMAKLQLAEKMESECSRQADIAEALDISIMTYHRWRKKLPVEIEPVMEALPRMAPLGKDGKGVSLRTENTQLRRMVIDLLLEKIRLEETLRAQSTRRRRPR